MNNNSREILFLYLIAEAVKLYVSETVEVKIRLEAMLLTVTDENSLRLCGAIVCIVKIAFAVKRFSVADNSPLTFFAFYYELNISRQILTEINNLLSLGSYDYFLCGEAFMLDNLFADSVFERRFAAGEHLCPARLGVGI